MSNHPSERSLGVLLSRSGQVRKIELAKNRTLNASNSSAHSYFSKLKNVNRRGDSWRKRYTCDLPVDGFKSCTEVEFQTPQQARSIILRSPGNVGGPVLILEFCDRSVSEIGCHCWFSTMT